LETVDSATSKPSLSSSPWIRGAPQRWGNRPTSLWISEDLGCCASG
jgi:hypothetical protein